MRVKVRGRESKERAKREHEKRCRNERDLQCSITEAAQCLALTHGPSVRSFRVREKLRRERPANASALENQVNNTAQYKIKLQ